MMKYVVEIFEIWRKDDEKRKLYIYIVRGYLNIIVAGPKVARGGVLSVIEDAITDADSVKLDHNGYSVSKYTIDRNLMKDFRKKVEEQKKKEKDEPKEIATGPRQGPVKLRNMFQEIQASDLAAAKKLANKQASDLAAAKKQANELADAKRLADELADELAVAKKLAEKLRQGQIQTGGGMSLS